MARKIIKTFISVEQKALKVFTSVACGEKLYRSVQIVLCGCRFVTVDNWSLSQWTFPDSFRNKRHSRVMCRICVNFCGIQFGVFAQKRRQLFRQTYWSIFSLYWRHLSIRPWKAKGTKSKTWFIVVSNFVYTAEHHLGWRSCGWLCSICAWKMISTSFRAAIGI